MTAEEYTVKGEWSADRVSFRDYVEHMARVFADGAVNSGVPSKRRAGTVEIRITASPQIGGCDCGGYCDHLDRGRPA